DGERQGLDAARRAHPVAPGSAGALTAAITQQASPGAKRRAIFFCGSATRFVRRQPIAPNAPVLKSWGTGRRDKFRQDAWAQRGMASRIAFRHRHRRPLRTTLDCAWISEALVSLSQIACPYGRCDARPRHNQSINKRRERTHGTQNQAVFECGGDWRAAGRAVGAIERATERAARRERRRE